MKKDDEGFTWFDNLHDALKCVHSSGQLPLDNKARSNRNTEDVGLEAEKLNLSSRLVEDIAGLTLAEGEWAILQADEKYLVFSQLRLGGLVIVNDPSGARVPANISHLLNEADVRVWVMRTNSNTNTIASNTTVHDDLGKKPLWRWFLPERAVILPIVLATIAINVLALAIPLATMNIFDRVISNSAFGTLWALAIGVFLASAFDFLLRNLRSSVIDQSSAKSDIKLTKNVFQRILGAKSSARFMPVGVQANALRELEGIREYFSSLTITVLGDLPFVCLFLLVISMVSGQLVFVPLLAMPVIFLVVLLGQVRLRKQAESAFQDSAHKNSVAVDVSSGIETIKLVGAENWAAKRWENAAGSQLRHSLVLRFWTATCVHMVSFLQGVTTAALLVYGVYLVSAGDLTPGALFAANLLTSRCLGPIASLATILTRMHQMKMALGSVKQLVEMEQESEADTNKLAPTPITQAIRFEDVSFSYDPEAAPVLKGINLSIEPGERVGIIGAIGSGKSTLLKLLVDLYQPTTGQILWNNIPTHHYDGMLLRKQIGSVFQNPTFFRGTIKDNILLGCPEASQDVLLRALQVSGSYGWIKSQPLGLDTQIGELGAGLSNGQRQTLAIARAFLNNPSCYLFDEPTSDLDSNTESAFVQNLKRLDASKTVILVTHRPLLLEAVNRLMVIERGRVILDGPKADVLQQLRSVVDEQKQKRA